MQLNEESQKNQRKVMCIGIFLQWFFKNYFTRRLKNQIYNMFKNIIHYEIL